MRISWKLEWLNWALIAGMFLLTAFTWGAAPSQLPVHWNWAGQIDAYGSREQVMLAYPIGALAIYLLLLLLPHIDPGQANYPRFAGSYTALRLALTVVAAAVYGATLFSGLGYPIDITRVVLSLVGALLIVLGNFMGKLRPNWFVGVRTPWTLSSRASWVKTHRLSGWTFIALGLALIVAALLEAQWAFMAAAILFVAGILWIFVYSYLVWRTDANRVPPSGSQPS